jgi:hypothetical protein
MSPLRLQLKKIMPRLSAQANKLRDTEARSRWMKLKLITMSSKSLSKACAFYGWSMDAYNKWGNRLRKNPRVESLLSKSRKPYRSPRLTKPKKVKKVLQLRRLDPSLGPERISNDLKILFNMQIPTSTVYAILKRAKMVSVTQACRLTKKHLKRYRRPWPGYLQMDFKYVPYKIEGRQLYQLSCVDHHSSWRMIRIYEDKSMGSVISFLDELATNCPFSIIEIQTDNDAAFTDKFSSQVGVTGQHAMDLWCMQRGIGHRLIPVGVKELNGKVENTHKQDDREFFARGPYRDLKQIRVCSQGYNLRWNKSRRTKALCWQTPEEVIQQAYVRALVFIRIWQDKINQPNGCVYRLDNDGNAGIVIKKQRPRKKIRTRKPTAVEKYLKYLDWVEEKKKMSIFFTYPTMSQSFSGLCSNFLR